MDNSHMRTAAASMSHFIRTSNSRCRRSRHKLHRAILQGLAWLVLNPIPTQAIILRSPE